MIPDNYGHGVPLRECYIDPGIRIWHKGEWREIPHYFDGSNTYSPNREIAGRNWRYLCIHAEKWKSEDNIFTFLNQIYTFLSDPFNPIWEKK